MACEGLTPSAYYKIMELIPVAMSRGKSPVELLEALKNLVYDTKLFIPGTITDEDLKTFIEVSDLSQDVKNGLLAANTNQTLLGTAPKDDDIKDDDEEGPGTPEGSANNYTHRPLTTSGTNSAKIDVQDVASHIVITAPKVYTITEAPKVTSLPDLYLTYFQGSNLAYSRFTSAFGKLMFGATYVSFDKAAFEAGTSLVRNNNDVNNNIQNIKNNYMRDLANFVGIPITEDTTLKQLTDAFIAKGIKNVEAMDAIVNNPEGDLARAYTALVALNNFNELIPGLVSNLNFKETENGLEYYTTTTLKGYSQYDDSIVNMVDEVSGIVKHMVEFLPILDINGKASANKFLNMNDVLNVTNKLKNLPKHKDYAYLSESLRLNPELKLKELLHKLLTDPDAMGSIKKEDGAKYFTANDFAIMRTLYNYFYKDANDSGLNGMNSDTVSLNQIKNHHYEQMGINYNRIVDAITTTIDKTVSLQYITVEETADGLVRKITKDLAINKYYSRLTSHLNSRANQPLSETLENIGDVNPNSVEVPEGKRFRIFKRNNQLYMKVNNHDRALELPVGNNSPTALTVEKLRKLKKKDFENYNQGKFNELDPKALATLDMLKGLSYILDLDLLQEDGDLLKLTATDTDTIIKNLAGIAGTIINTRSVLQLYRSDNADNSNLAEFLNVNYKGLSDVYRNGVVNVFSSGNQDITVLKTLANSLAVLKGEIASAISRNLNGDGLPNNGLLNLINDDGTVFSNYQEQLNDGADKFTNMVLNNLFVAGDNKNMIAGTILRADVKMRDGSIKSVKKFSAGEIMHQALFGDFWQNAFDSDTKGKVLMEPTVFADKSGQAMKVFDLNAKISFKHGDFKVENKSLFELMNEQSELGYGTKADDLYYHTMRSQYEGLYNKLMTDYRKIIDNFNNSGTGQNVEIHGRLDVRTVNNFLKMLKDNGYNVNNYLDGVDIQDQIHFVDNQMNSFLVAKFNEFDIENDTMGANHQIRMRKEDKKFAQIYQDLIGDVKLMRDDGTIDPQFKPVVESYLHNVKGVTLDQLEAETKKFLTEWVDQSTGYLKVTNRDSSVLISTNDVYNDNTKLEINPLLKHMQTAHRVLIGNYNMAMVGTPAAHKARINKDIIGQFNNPDTLTGDLKAVYEGTLATFNGNRDKAIEAIRQEMEESARTIAMFKRMVSYQATIHSFTLGLLSGVTRNLKLMVVKDISRNVWNSSGDESGFDVADGSGWVPMVAAKLYRNSMGDAGTDSVSLKTIRHALDTDTGAAHLDKHATQAMANEMLRMSYISKLPWARLNEIALGTVKFNEVFPDGLAGNLFGNRYALDLTGQNVEAEPVIDESNLAEVAANANLGTLNVIPRTYHEGLGTFTETKGIAYLPQQSQANGVDTYLVAQEFKNKLGQPDFPTDPNYIQYGDGLYYKVVKVNSLYDVWNELLGGAYSVSENSKGNHKIGDKRYKYDDSSHESLASLMCNVVIPIDSDLVKTLGAKGIKILDAPKSPRIANQAFYYQPLKEALIWQINNSTGMKNGAKNINSFDIVANRDMPVKFFTSDSTHYGIQGNFDHFFSEEHEALVSEATQVISAAEINGFMTQTVNRLYRSLAQVIQNSISEEKRALLDDNGEIANILTRRLMQTMKDKEHRGLGLAYFDLVKQDLERLKAEGKINDYDENAYRAAFSDNNFYGAMVSMIAGAFNSGSIRRQLSGIASVLSQGHDAMTVVQDEAGRIRLSSSLYYETVRRLKDSNFVDGKFDHATFNQQLSDYIRDMRSGEFKNAKEIALPDFRSIGQYDIVRVRDAQGNEKTFEIQTRAMYYALKDGKINTIKGFENFDPATTQYFKLTNVPRNLRSASLSAKVIIDGVQVELNEMDLDTSRALYDLNFYKEGKVINPKIASLIAETLMEEGVDDIKSDANFRKVKNALLIKQLNELVKLSQGKLTYNGITYDADVTVEAGEIIMSNYNRHKFGLKEGMALSDITLTYFYETLGLGALGDGSHLKQPNINEHTDFYLFDKKGRHLQFIKAENLVKIEGYTVDLNNARSKTFDGVDYWVDAKGDKIAPKIEGQRMLNINGQTFITYTDLSQVKQAYDVGYFLDLCYNFNSNNTLTISEYIKTHRPLDSVIIGKKNGIIEYKQQYAQRVKGYAETLYKSFQDQLRMIGARIPAQSYQSFMAMKIVGFTEEDVNRAYVPIKKNWLDGSDF